MIRAGACPALTAPHRPQARACTWYSVTLGGGGGTISNSCSFCTPVTRAPARSAPHRPQAAGAHTTTSSGSATCRSVEDSAPGCLPRFRPLRPRSDRSRGFFLYGLSDDGGLDDVPESLPRRRSSSATRSLSAANPRLRRLQGSPGRRELRVLGLDDLAQPGIGGAQRGHQRGKFLPGRLGRQIGHKPP